MAFVNECSGECAKAELDLFSVPPTQTSVEMSSYSEYHPLTSLDDGSFLEFEITGSGEDYIDLANTYLHVRAKVTQSNGNDLVDDDAVAPVNNFLHSLFLQVDIFLNGTQITSSTNTYPYRAIIESLLSYGKDAKETQLAGSLFHKDQAERMDAVTVDNTANSGFMTRRAAAAGSRVLDMMGRIHQDLFFQDRYLLNDVNVKIRLTRSKNVFCLMSTNAAKAVKIISAELFVRKVRLSASVMVAHAKTLEVATAKYPIKRVVCKTFTIPNGLRDANQEKLFSGQLPTRLVIGLVDNQGFNGAINRNPFNFRHFNLSEIGIYLDGQQGQMIKPLKTDFENGQYIEAYMSLFTGTNKINRDEGNFITSAEYPNGYALYAFDLTPDLCEGINFNLVKQGTVRLALKFSDALDRAVTVVAYAEFENVIEIDRSRNIIFDFSS